MSFKYEIHLHNYSKIHFLFLQNILDFNYKDELVNIA
jgi:hypothetical protein